VVDAFEAAPGLTREDEASHNSWAALGAASSPSRSQIFPATVLAPRVPKAALGKKSAAPQKTQAEAGKAK
jgi:hypothetical protein